MALQILLNDTYKLNHCKEMGAKLGRRFLKQPAEKLKAVFVACFPLEITHVRDDERQREATRFKQSVTFHEKSGKAEPFNVHWKRAMKLIFSYSLFQTQLL